ncbi:dihydrolipoyllysine-residue succinyltransferase component of 2-oxoglutarate dehydrogenase complex, mitochondrial [Octopus sinensis]|uniref:Dihydrolipoyllysine-residue succinyltransferase component of 2-oxoglutarate dehydrogenase complex, mitochondrial n=1 Tax=Octopus sinensis TaxID=2607531 RepID=A0A6P7SX48_9MOLL|nr:dihydrolipoyllysine-residue succinyltransferase component of 2-oxoglutarate dehydrogenase complex, mitochondrial [Octopus sinensis]
MLSSNRLLSQISKRFFRSQIFGRQKTGTSIQKHPEVITGVLRSRSLPSLYKKYSNDLCYKCRHTRPFHSSALLFDDFHIVLTPHFAESVTEGDIVWVKAIGDSVAVDDVVAEIETDKTTIPVPSPVAGVIEEFFVEDGEKVEAEQKLFKLKLSAGGAAPSAAAAPAPPPAAAAAETSPPPPPPAAAAAGPIPSTPPPVTPLPSKPMATTPPSTVQLPKPATAAAAAVPAVASAPNARTEQRVKMNRMRQKIAQRLKDAQDTCAMLTTFNEINMSNVMDLRKQYKDLFLKKHNLKLGFMSAFVKASAFALQDQPIVNAVIEEKEIVYRDYIDISVAVATPKGLVVPVLRNVEDMNYAAIERTIHELGEKARLGALAIEDMDGGTFTISNGGVFGSMFGTPIINPPQSAILGMHAIIDRPMAVNGKVEICPMMYVALTYDHRLIDGREAVLFLRKIKQAVEDPRVLLLDI